ncbi:cysteine desulfurase family protein [Dyadobacter aurulentus]|uniref:cysteine desulfurase family protein n=1 Tax=Dyadobacter sp. UC 10 TaxID=2605428 RepID=UPI0011F306BA|nr:aminotransferase class V-fold PLP-dependent enzyme [Dyadobacter sp. UC 10]KAA0989303.1 aminotransferase class V-fold PLP-dependent enzyme [Dyadobacter sp. UC 10]
MSLRLPVYLDNNATTPMDPRVLEEMLPYFIEKFGNAASRTHSYGWEAEEAVDIAREQIASLIGAHPNEIVFTSGATEAVNLAIKGVLENDPRHQKHVITVCTEHKAVLDSCKHVENGQATVTYLPVRNDGTIELQNVENAITEETILISVMYANNETGVIYPIREIASIARRHNILFMTDATQAVGKIPVNVQDEGIDLLTLSAHKLYGPKGIGALFVRKKSPAVHLTAQIDGGGHERNMRSGTLNVPGIAGFGKACELCMEEMESESERLRKIRDIFESALMELEGVSVNGNMGLRLPHTTNIAFQGIDGEKLIFEAGNDIAFSRSSACTSATLEPSYVLKAMGMSDEAIHTSFRFSFGRFSTEEHALHSVKVLSRIVNAHRSERVF